MKTNKLTFYQLLLKIQDRQVKNYVAQFFLSEREYWSVQTPNGWVYGLYSKEQCKKIYNQFYVI